MTFNLFIYYIRLTFNTFGQSYMVEGEFVEPPPSPTVKIFETVKN